jgi:NAD(P)-dependent dehydrogenase (short-subunit alcohol dehydrogenase family)
MTKKSYTNKKLRTHRLNRLIIKRYGKPEEIADLVYFLCSEKSKYINGQDIVIDGGFLKKGV